MSTQELAFLARLTTIGAGKEGNVAGQDNLVDVVVVNWNGWARLDRCLAALARQTLRDVAVWVVDNGSCDGSPARVRAGYPWVQLLENDDNRGFAEGNNRGIVAGHAPFVATLNNDTCPEPGWLETLVSALEREPEVGMVASKMLCHDRPDRIDSAGIAINRAGIAWDRLGGTLDTPGATPVEIFGPCAGAALYRRAMLADVGLFDGDLFCYLEDVDLAWRARLAGWRALYAPAARVGHVHSGTLGDLSPLKSYLLGRNKLWTIVKNYPDPYLGRRWPLIVSYDLLAAAYAVLVQGRFAALRGRLASWGGLKRAWSKRRAIQRRRRVPAAEVDRWLEPLDAPWRLAGRYAHRSGHR